MAEPLPVGPGLTPQQGPPLSIPLSFFATAAIVLGAAGVFMTWRGIGLLSLRYLPETLALVHLLTLGVLAMVMIGALYQMIPVVGGAPLPIVRHAHVVHAALLAGAVLLAAAFASGHRGLFMGAGTLLLLAVLIFVAAAAWSLFRGRARNETIWGLRLSVVALLATVTFGLVLLMIRLGALDGASAPRWLLAHAGLGIGAWIGGLIAAVSWQVVPMFYLTPPIPPLARRITLGLLLASLLGAIVTSTLANAEVVTLASLLPAAAAAGIVHPLVVARALSSRRRRRVGESVRFFWSAMASGGAAVITGAVAIASGEPRWVMLFGWLALIGWAATLIHGMLTRIVPFLVWFHRYSGRSDVVPSMRDLLPETWVRAGFVLQSIATVLGAAAIVARADLLARGAGVAIVATAAVMLGVVLKPLQRPPVGSPAR